MRPLENLQERSISRNMQIHAFTPMPHGTHIHPHGGEGRRHEGAPPRVPRGGLHPIPVEGEGAALQAVGHQRREGAPRAHPTGDGTDPMPPANGSRDNDESLADGTGNLRNPSFCHRHGSSPAFWSPGAWAEALPLVTDPPPPPRAVAPHRRRAVPHGDIQRIGRV